MNQTIENVARALWALETETDCPNWDRLAQFKKDETYDKARAAIAAMRDPGDAVLSEVGAWGVCAGNLPDAWNAGIDAILKETP